MKMIRMIRMIRMMIRMIRMMMMTTTRKRRSASQFKTSFNSKSKLSKSEYDYECNLRSFK